ncbi:MAG: outer membrane protein transport protein [Candidatus Eisenbacteria bacterium]|nr:outer membrane protein transport protein [Candidatus Eisenbacteria bacterium]
MRVSFRSRALAGFVLAALAAAGPASAYTYLESAWGTPVSAQSARGLAMGGATVAVPDGSYSLLSNPAMMSSQKGRAVEMSVRGARYDETRYVPLFDSFDSYIKDTAITENPESYVRVNGGVLWQPNEENPRFSVAGGIFERYNFQYDFVDERRVANGRDAANRDKVQATQFIRSSTSIYSASAGVSYKERILALGASLHYYFGNLTFSNTTIPGPAPAPYREAASRNVLSRDLNGVGATFGASADLDERVTVAASYTLPVTLDTDWRYETLSDTTTGNNDVEYPGQLAIGVSLNPRNNPRTLFSMSAVRTFWESDLVDPVLEANLAIATGDVRNSWDFHAGVEHVFYNNLPARFGFIYRELYAAEDVDEAGVAFGVGYKFETWDVGFGMNVLKRNSRQNAITPRTNPNDPKTDRVTDSLLTGVVDIRYRF